MYPLRLQTSKLNIDNIAFDIEEVLCYYQHNEGDIFKEAHLSFKLNVRKDDAWYEIVVGEASEGSEYYITEVKKFRSIKKAVDWWNERFKDIS